MEFASEDLFHFVLNGQHDRLRDDLVSGITPMLQRDGLTPLHLAAACDDLEAASILFEAGALGCTPLHIACDRGCAPMVRWLLGRGANAYLDVYLDGGPEGFWDWSPLKLAAGQSDERPHQDVVLLLEQWARHRPKTDADEAVAAYRHRRVSD